MDEKQGHIISTINIGTHPATLAAAATAVAGDRRRRRGGGHGHAEPWSPKRRRHQGGERKLALALPRLLVGVLRSEIVAAEGSPAARDWPGIAEFALIDVLLRVCGMVWYVIPPPIISLPRLIDPSIHRFTRTHHPSTQRRRRGRDERAGGVVIVIAYHTKKRHKPRPPTTSRPPPPPSPPISHGGRAHQAARPGAAGCAPLAAGGLLPLPGVRRLALPLPRRAGLRLLGPRAAAHPDGACLGFFRVPP